MRDKMMVLGTVLLVAMTVGMGVARAGMVVEYMPGKECEIGADVRLRLTDLDREGQAPGVNDNNNATQFMRVDTRVWGTFEFGPDSSLYVRLANQFRVYGSREGDNNADAATYEFGDEIIVDNLYVDLHHVLGSDWSLRLGRQDFIMGSGMILLEGTPGDESRSIYMDGVLATWETEASALKLFAFYNDARDRAGAISDEERALRVGDTTIVGLDYTQRINDALSGELYAISSNIDEAIAQDANANPLDGQLRIGGIRLFGGSAPWDYSVEYARQFGQYDGNRDFDGSMLEARIGVAFPDAKLAPKVSLRYTSLSGDDAGSDGDYEGWCPALGGMYPTWREELTVYHFMNPMPAYWSDLDRISAQIALQLTEKVRLTTAYDVMNADEDDANGDDHYGDVVSAFLDVKVLDNLDVAVEYARHFAGDRYDNGQDGDWTRLQAIYRF